MEKLEIMRPDIYRLKQKDLCLECNKMIAKSLLIKKSLGKKISYWL